MIKMPKGINQAKLDEINKTIAQDRKIVASWPAWKRGILVQSND